MQECHRAQDFRKLEGPQDCFLGLHKSDDIGWRGLSSCLNCLDLCVSALWRLLCQGVTLDGIGL